MTEQDHCLTLLTLSTILSSCLIEKSQTNLAVDTYALPIYRTHTMGHHIGTYLPATPEDPGNMGFSDDRSQVAGYLPMFGMLASKHINGILFEGELIEV